jgi:hypothetical protein
MKRVAIAFSACLGTIAAVAATLWFGYFWLYWLVGKIAGPSLGLAVIAAPVCALLAFALGFYVLTIGMRVAIKLDEQFFGAHDGSSV